jgi:hypothetical protein
MAYQKLGQTLKIAGWKYPKGLGSPARKPSFCKGATGMGEPTFFAVGQKGCKIEK